jgi:hypothetical protein
MLLGLLGPASAGTPATAQVVDALAVLPDRRLSKYQYVRYLMQATIQTDDDLPFTTSGAFGLPAPRSVWLGVFVRTPSVWTSAHAEVRVVARREDFPEFVHGGCAVVNLVADAETGETLGSWCNVNGGQPVRGRPTPLATRIGALGSLLKQPSPLQERVRWTARGGKPIDECRSPWPPPSLAPSPPALCL